IVPQPNADDAFGALTRVKGLVNEFGFVAQAYPPIRALISRNRVTEDIIKCCLVLVVCVKLPTRGLPTTRRSRSGGITPARAAKQTGVWGTWIPTCFDTSGLTAAGIN
ncbi:MAG: hypothetical protein AAFR23_05985, partial [Pseudomonadota bacterium]